VWFSLDGIAICHVTCGIAGDIRATVGSYSPPAPAADNGRSNGGTFAADGFDTYTDRYSDAVAHAGEHIAVAVDPAHIRYAGLCVPLWLKAPQWGTGP